MNQLRDTAPGSTVTADRPPAGGAARAVPGVASAIRATVMTVDGRRISGGLLEIGSAAADGSWTAVLRHLDQPGALATVYFAEGVREVRVKLEDGRTARARVRRTLFAGRERTCELSGMGFLS